MDTFKPLLSQSLTNFPDNLVKMVGEMGLTLNHNNLGNLGHLGLGPQCTAMLEMNILVPILLREV